MSVNSVQDVRVDTSLSPGADPASRFATHVVAVMMVIAFYYLAYRYPFQIGDSGTSPTYKDTPAALQVGKYVLLIAVLVAALLMGALLRRARKRLSSDPFWGTTFALLFIGLFAGVKGLFSGSTEVVTFAIVFLLGTGLTGFALRWRLDTGLLGRLVSVYAVISVAVEAVQYLLFRTQGRLPALAYEGSISVRFGAVLDDPNGYAIIVALLLPVVASWRYHRRWRFLVVCLLLVTLLATQSFTGIVSTIAALVGGYMVLNWRSSNKALLVVFGGGFLAVIAWTYTSASPVFQEILGTKLGSISAHSTSVTALSQLGPESFLGFGAMQPSIESSYVYLVANFGLVFTLIFVGLGVLAIGRLHRRISHSPEGEDVAIYKGYYYFLIAFLLACSNLHVVGVYPANLLFVLGVVTSLFAPLTTTDLAPTPAQPHASRSARR